MANMACSLIEHKHIKTTLAKAKALKRYIEPLVTKSRTNTTHSRRVAFGYLQNKEAIKELFGPISAAIGDRPGGYTRVIRTGFRQTDSAEMALIEFVDFNTVYSKDKDDEKDQRRRTRRGRRKRSDADAIAGTAVATTEEE